MDYYDHAVAYLTERPEEIVDAWCEPDEDGYEHPAHKLFARVSPSGYRERSQDGKECGCLTQIRCSEVWGEYPRVAFTDALTREIAADTRIPLWPHLIRPDHLPAFAELMRRIDKELDRDPPVWVEPEVSNAH